MNGTRGIFGSTLCGFAFPLLLLTFSASAQDASYVEEIVQRIDRSEGGDVTLGNSAYDKGGDEWVVLQDDGSIERHTDALGWEMAQAWFESAGVCAVRFTEFAESGDWSLETLLVFRPDGTLCWRRSDLRTFHGNVWLRRTSSYGRRGGATSVRSEFRDLDTREPIPPTEAFVDVRPRYFKKAKSLPFWKTLHPLIPR